MISLRHIFTNSLGTFVSRVLGLIRLQVIGVLFGFPDAFWGAYRIPNAVRLAMSEGVLNNALVVSLQSFQSSEKARKLAGAVMIHFLLISLASASVLYFFSPQFVALILPGFTEDPDKFDKTVRLLRIMAFFLVFISLQSVCMGILNSVRRFFAPAFAPAFMNLSMITFALALSGRIGEFSLAYGVVAGAFAMFLFQVFFIMDEETRPIFSSLFPDGIGRFYKLFLPALGFMMTAQLLTVLSVMFASFYESGVSALQNAYLIIQFPVGVGAVSVSLVFLSSGARSEKDVGINLGESIKILALIIVPFAFLFGFYSREIVEFVFRDLVSAFTGGKNMFGEREITLTAGAMVAYIPAFIAISLNLIVSRSFFMKGNPWKNSVANLTGAGVFTATMLVFRHFDFDYRAVALSLGVGLLSAVFIQFLFVEKDVRKSVSGFGEVVKVVVAGAVPVPVLLFIKGGLFLKVLAGVVYFLVFGVVLILLGNDVMLRVVSRLRRR